MSASFRKLITIQVEVDFGIDADDCDGLFVDGWTCLTELDDAIQAYVDTEPEELQAPMAEAMLLFARQQQEDFLVGQEHAA